MLKLIKAIWSIFRTIVSIILIILLVIIIVQRVSNNTKSVAGFRIFTVATESMVPDYLVGDAIFTRSVDPSEIKIGDDVTYMGKEQTFKDKIVTHRVVDIKKGEDGKYIFETKGIANDVPDPKINETQLFGKVIYKIKSISFLNGIMGNLYGMYFAILVPFGLIIIIEYIANKRDREKEYEDEDEEEIDKEDKEYNKKEKEENEEEEKEEEKKREKEKNNKNRIDESKERRKKRRNRRRERRKIRNQD